MSEITTEQLKLLQEEVDNERKERSNLETECDNVRLRDVFVTAKTF